MTTTTTASLTPIMDRGRVLLTVEAQQKLVARVESAVWRMSKRNVHDQSLVLYAFTARDPAFDAFASVVVDVVQVAYTRRMGGSLAGRQTENLTETDHGTSDA